jgi:hypothetical protein
VRLALDELRGADDAGAHARFAAALQRDRAAVGAEEVDRDRSLRVAARGRQRKREDEAALRGIGAGRLERAELVIGLDGRRRRSLRVADVRPLERVEQEGRRLEGRSRRRLLLRGRRAQREERKRERTGGTAADARCMRRRLARIVHEPRREATGCSSRARRERAAPTMRV